MKIENRIQELGFTLPAASLPKAMYVPIKRVGNILYISGQIPVLDGVMYYPGKVGKDISLEDAKKAAEICVLNMLSVIRNELGDLDKVKQFIKLQGFVNSTDTFHEQHLVVNGASSLLYDILGENGRHTRTVIACNTLALNASVEIDAIVEIKEDIVS